MDASRLTNGSKHKVAAKGFAPAPRRVQVSAVGSQTRKADERSTEKKVKTERPQAKAGRKSKSDKLYCGSDDLAPSFIKRRERRCRKCFSERYGSAARPKKVKVKK